MAYAKRLGFWAGLLLAVIYVLRYLIVPVQAGISTLDDILLLFSVAVFAYLGVVTKKKEGNAPAAFAGFLAGIISGVITGVATVFGPQYVELGRQHPAMLGAGGRVAVILVDAIVTVSIGTIVAALAAIATARRTVTEEG